MEGRAGQCQLVSRIKTTHLFTEVSCEATRPKQGEAKGGEEGRDRGSVKMREGPLVSGPRPSLPHHPTLWPCFFFCPLLIFLGLPEAITAVYGRQSAGWHLLVFG